MGFVSACEHGEEGRGGGCGDVTFLECILSSVAVALFGCAPPPCLPPVTHPPCSFGTICNCKVRHCSVWAARCLILCILVCTQCLPSSHPLLFPDVFVLRPPSDP